MKKY
ncbi:hypothetical protein F383_38858 [Gossypium arboreum]|jgi:hypothetical protein